ncbi:hypothetical protein AB0H73_35110 [Streptomyces olivoreticuli]
MAADRPALVSPRATPGRDAESVEGLRAARDRLADFVRALAVDNPQTMALDGHRYAQALDLLDSLPAPQRCPGADPGAPGHGHAFLLRNEDRMRCLHCRSLRPEPHEKDNQTCT